MTWNCCCVAITNEKLQQPDCHVCYKEWQLEYIYIYCYVIKRETLEVSWHRCIQFSLWSAIETRCCTLRDVITAVRWVETTLFTKGCIWKCKPLQKSRSETHVSSSSYSYHNAVQRDASSSQIPCRNPLQVRLWKSEWCYVISGYALRSYIITGVCYFLFLCLRFIIEQCCTLFMFSVCAIVRLYLLKSGSVFVAGTQNADERIRLMQCLCNCMNSTL
jgi:hypothetical protein